MPSGWVPAATALALGSSAVASWHYRAERAVADTDATPTAELRRESALPPGAAAQIAKLESDLERIRRANRSLGERHQGLSAIPAALHVPPPPAETAATVAAAALVGPTPTGVARLVAELGLRNLGGGPADSSRMRKKKRQNKREPLLLESSYDIDGDRGRPVDIKAEMNSAVCEALRRCCVGEEAACAAASADDGDDDDGERALASWLQHDPKNVLVVIDSPSLGSCAALQAAFPCLVDSQQIIVPQYDLAHYVSTINTTMPGGYVGVRLQRLDQWLCANAQRGFSCRLFLADVESAFLGHANKQLCPAADLLRWLRFGYPAARSVLVLTFDQRTAFPTMEDVEGFVLHECANCGIVATCRNRWRYGLGCLLFELRRL